MICSLTSQIYLSLGLFAIKFIIKTFQLIYFILLKVQLPYTMLDIESRKDLDLFYWILCYSLLFKSLLKSI